MDVGLYWRRWWCYGSDMFSNHSRSFPTGSAPSFSFYTPAYFRKLLEVIADLKEQVFRFILFVQNKLI